VCKRPYIYSKRAGHTLTQCSTCRTGDRRRNRRERAVRLLGGACQLCGYSRCLWALDVHHLDPSSKDFDISSANTRRWAVTVQELRKCVLLCRNCHQEVHAGMADPPRARGLLEGSELEG
jgi:5-methylcytosine-specific restriction endonuclease McrA